MKYGTRVLIVEIYNYIRLFIDKPSEPCQKMFVERKFHNVNPSLK